MVAGLEGSIEAALLNLRFEKHSDAVLAERPEEHIARVAKIACLQCGLCLVPCVECWLNFCEDSGARALVLNT